MPCFAKICLPWYSWIFIRDRGVDRRNGGGNRAIRESGPGFRFRAIARADADLCDHPLPALAAERNTGAPRVGVQIADLRIGGQRVETCARHVAVVDSELQVMDLDDPRAATAERR